MGSNTVNQAGKCMAAAWNGGRDDELAITVYQVLYSRGTHILWLVAVP